MKTTQCRSWRGKRHFSPRDDTKCNSGLRIAIVAQLAIPSNHTNGLRTTRWIDQWRAVTAVTPRSLRLRFDQGDHVTTPIARSMLR